MFLTAAKSKSKNGSKRSLKNILALIGKIAIVLFVSLSWLFIFVDFEVLANNSYQSLWVHCPSVVEADEPFYITVEAWDKFERLASSYQGEVEIKIESYQINQTGPGFEPLTLVTWTLSDTNFRFSSNFLWGGIFPGYLITGANNGKRAFNVSISTPGVHYFNVTDKTTGRIYWSNPVVVIPIGFTADRLYWGDIHGHTSYSDGSGLPYDAYQFARDVALLDFAALTDHSEMFPQFYTYPLFNKFEHYLQTTNSFNQDDKFTTLIALEWTPLLAQQRSYLSNQHVNFYFSGNDMPFFSTFTHFTPDEIYQYIRESTNDEFIAWTHHVTRSDYGSDFAFYDESINRMIEIYSEHGNGEFVESVLNPYPAVHSFKEGTHGYSVNDLLRMGRKCGIMASSDTHDGRLGHPIVHTGARGAANTYPYTLAAYNFGAYPGGLTGLYSNNLTRTSVFNALKNRSAYATSWVNRHFMNFTINNLTVGQNDSTVIVPDVNALRTLEITVIADGISLIPNVQTKISKIEIFKNSVPWRTVIVNDLIYHDTINDTDPITGANYTHCIQKPDGNWYIHERSVKPVNPALLNTNGTDYYYVRMTDTRGGLGWIGPIWVDPIS